MPLAAFSMDPVTAAHLRAIGLPNGPTTAPPDAATTSMGLNAALGASPMTNGSQTPPVTPQQNAQLASDTADIFGGMTPPQPQSTAPPAGQAARLQAAQSAMQPQAYNPAVAGASIDGAQAAPGAVLPSSQGEATPASLIQALQSRTPGYSEQQARLAAAQQVASPQTPPQAPPQATSDSAASGPSPQLPAAAPGAPSGTQQSPQATTPAAAPQTTAQPSPAPGAAPAGGPVTPAAIADAIYGQESGYGQNTKTSPTGARGGMQIEPATWAQYALPDEDINNPVDNRKVGNRIVQDLYQKAGGDPARVAVGYYSGPGNIAPPGSPTPWIHDISGAAAHGGPPVSQYVSQVLGRLGQPGQFTGATSSSSSSAPGIYSGIDAIHQGSAIGIDPKEMMGLAQSLGYKPVDTDAFNNRNLMAMGMAMMGGRTFADSMKNGAGVMNDSNNAMLGVQEKTNANALQMAQLGINDKRTTAMMANEQARTAALDRPRQTGAPTQQADGSWAQMFLDPRTGTTYTQPTGAPASFANSDPTRRAGTALLGTQMKDNEKTIQDYADPHIQNQAQSVIRQANELQELIQKNRNVIGGDITSKFNRYIANVTGANLNGLDPNDVSTASKLINQTNTNGIFGQTHGNLQRVTGQEFQKIGGGQVNFDTQPGAALALLEANKQDAQTALAVSSRLNGLSEIDRQHYVTQPGGADRLVNDTLAEINAKRGTSDFKSGPNGPQPVKGVQTQEQPAYTPSAGYVAPNGISIKFSQ